MPAGSATRLNIARLHGPVVRTLPKRRLATPDLSRHRLRDCARRFVLLRDWFLREAVSMAPVLSDAL